MSSKRTGVALTLLASLLVVACSGGGGDPSTEPVVPAVVKLEGIAATGAPMKAASIIVKDATDAEVQDCAAATSCKTDDEGLFTITLKQGAKAPFVLTATPADGGDPQVSMTASAAGGRVNITPISTLIAAQLSSSRDPSALKGAAFDAEKLQAAAKLVLDALKPLLQAVGKGDIDPLTAPFKADGTGIDKALDVLAVRVDRSDDGKVEVVAEIKLAGDETQPARLTIAPGADKPAATDMGKVAADKMPVDGLAPMMAQFLKDLTACYNLSYADRVDTSTTPHTLKSAQCKDLFVNSDPTKYKHNSYVVSGTAGAWAGMHRSRETTGPDKGRNLLTYDQPVYEFTRTNGDIVMSWRWRDLNGNMDWDVNVLRKNPSTGKLQIIGNQENYDVSVSPYVQRRLFLQKDSTGMSYDGSGYRIYVRNHLVDGNARFDRVLVTTPSGRELLLKPLGGFDRLGLVKSGSTKTTNVIRLQWAFLGSDKDVGPSTQKTIPQLETGLLFFDQAWTDADIKAIPAKGRWKFEFFEVGNSSTTPNSTQFVMTRARAQTLGEMRARPFAELVPNLRETIAQQINPLWNGVVLNDGDKVDLTEPDGSPTWTVPAGAVPPRAITVIGSFYPGFAIESKTGSSAFSDDSSVATTARSGVISCSKASNSDPHCSATTSGTYATGAVLNFLELFARDSQGVERATAYQFYKLVP